MILRVLSSEFLKIRKKLIWFLVVLGPFGVVGLQAVNFGLRYEYLVKGQYKDELWSGLIENVSLLMLPAMFIGLAILASMTAGIEHQMNAWKMTLALPVRKTDVFAGKLLLTLALLFVSCSLLIPFTAALGWALGFRMNVPWELMLLNAYVPFVAALPLVALQTWLSVSLHNQALPLTLGIFGTVASMFAERFPDWVPWKWPVMTATPDDRLYALSAGLVLGAVLFLVGMNEFVRKDVK
ncbi:ABC transporter permease [Cohnella faecalis]|uniref:Permease n=1 Tax=Cohnella faecalis TaxID=2315694 RepID=A0A398CSQ7_9BACL|nr:ABC transporter permease [Cohnella faecalis]RIE05190.1 permease [Cohnella faecalis]